MTDSLVIYRKYRPQSFDDVVGQHHIVDTLKSALKIDRLAHAYLFAGPHGVGKTSIARIMAKAVNCAAGLDKDKPCNACPMCVLISTGRALDVFELDAASNRGIDQIRQLLEVIQYPPSATPKKVFIIDEVHMLTKEAFNALLKTLEEPPVHAFFVLATTEIAKVPKTIVSRTQHFSFQRISARDISNRLMRLCDLEHVKHESDALDLLAVRAQGSLRDAESMLEAVLAHKPKKIDSAFIDKILGLVDFQTINNFFGKIFAHDASEATRILHRDIVEGGRDVDMFLEHALKYLRHVLFAKVDVKLIGDDLTTEEKSVVAAQAAGVEAKIVERAIETFKTAHFTLRQYPLIQMSTELAIIESCNMRANEIEPK